MKRFLPAVALALCVFGPAAKAADPRLFIPVAYDPKAEVPDKIRSECGLDYKLQEEAAHQLKAHDKTWEPTETLDGRVIRIAIVYVRGGGGGGFTGAKEMSARVELLEDGKVQRNTIMHISASSVPILTFRGTCAILDRAARGIGKRVAEWARHPEKQYQENVDLDVNATAPAAEASAASDATK